MICAIPAWFIIIIITAPTSFLLPLQLHISFLLLHGTTCTVKLYNSHGIVIHELQKVIHVALLRVYFVNSNWPYASQCNKEIKCKVCKQFGHKSTSCPDNENVLRHSATNEVINTGNNATAAAQPDDETGRMTDGQGQQPDTTRSSHASSSASTQRTDDVNTRTKVNRQSDISYFLRTNKPTVSTPGHTDNERDRTCEQTEQRSEDSNSFSSDDSRTDEEQQTIQKSPTPKKKPKKKAEKKKGSTRK